MNPVPFAAVLIAALAGLVAVRPSTARSLVIAAWCGWIVLGLTVMVAIAAAGPWIVPDPLAMVTMLLTGFVGAIVLAFSRRYLRADADPRGYAVKVLLLLAAIVLFASAHDLRLIALGWVASGWLLAGLIGHVAAWPDAAQARRRTLATFAIGDLALVGAIAVIMGRTGAATVSTAGHLSGPAATLAALLLALAAAVRCAVPPFQRWLGRSMTAPTPVSALMHAGFVNGGGVLLIRFAPLMEAAPLARAVTVAVGLAAALIGTGIMMVRPDIKRSLAGSTSAQMGFMLMTCGLGAYAAALWHVVAHGLFKAWLFLRSGSAIGIGERPVSGRLTPVTVAGIGAIVIAASIGAGMTGRIVPASVPLLLAVAMALATVSQVGRHATLALVLLALGAGYAAGLMLFEHLIVPAAGPLLGGVILSPAIVAVFMVAWLVQALVLDGRIRMPLPLYARLLNA